MRQALAKAALVVAASVVAAVAHVQLNVVGLAYRNGTLALRCRMRRSSTRCSRLSRTTSAARHGAAGRCTTGWAVHDGLHLLGPVLYFNASLFRKSVRTSLFRKGGHRSSVRASGRRAGTTPS